MHQSVIGRPTFSGTQNLTRVWDGSPLERRIGSSSPTALRPAPPCSFAPPRSGYSPDAPGRTRTCGPLRGRRGGRRGDNGRIFALEAGSRPSSLRLPGPLLEADRRGSGGIRAATAHSAEHLGGVFHSSVRAGALARDGRAGSRGFTGDVRRSRGSAEARHAQGPRAYRGRWSRGSGRGSCCWPRGACRQADQRGRVHRSPHGPRADSTSRQYRLLASEERGSPSQARSSRIKRDCR
jgi:hypothetical protein